MTNLFFVNLILSINFVIKQIRVPNLFVTETYFYSVTQNLICISHLFLYKSPIDKIYLFRLFIACHTRCTFLSNYSNARIFSALLITHCKVLSYREFNEDEKANRKLRHLLTIINMQIHTGTGDHQEMVGPCIAGWKVKGE